MHRLGAKVDKGRIPYLDRISANTGESRLWGAILRPVMRRLFPDVPAEHPAMGAMVMNMAANMLGLGNAATPLGLRAMALLQKLNPHPTVASNAMVTFLAVNTASLQLIPTTAISEPKGTASTKSGVGGTVYGTPFNTRSGFVVHPFSGHSTAGGASLGSPLGAPLSTHCAMVSISSCFSDRSFEK